MFRRRFWAKSPVPLASMLLSSSPLFASSSSKCFYAPTGVARRFCSSNASTPNNNNNNNNNNNSDKNKKKGDDDKKEPLHKASPGTTPPAAAPAEAGTPTPTTTTSPHTTTTTTAAAAAAGTPLPPKDSSNSRHNKSSSHNTKKKPSPDMSKDEALNNTFAKDNAVPKGFEAFYSRVFTRHMPQRRKPDESILQAFTMTPEERVLSLQIAKQANLRRTWRNILIVSALFTLLVTFRWYRTRRAGDADVSHYHSVVVNLPAHTAVFLDAEGKYLGARSFIDYDAFEKTCDPKKDIIVLFSSYYPFVPMLLLCLLPLLVMLNAGSSRSAKLISTMANKDKRLNYKREMSVQTRLKDVAGLTEAKQEVVEVIDFLKHPERYQRLGATLPKGVLLDGPPGVGKTLLAKAVAGEAMVPFLSCAGSEFDEVYVGVGAQRVRQLFADAHRCKPCVVFIDEIDAFGRSRRSESRGGSRGTLNAFLSELDGFKDASGIIVLAATNRTDILDKALTRSGRFDRKIFLEKPPYKDRVAIAKVHLAPLHLDPVATLNGYAETLAALTPGCSGADIFNVCNEAAIFAAREGRPHVGLAHFHRAVERVLVGLEKSAVQYQPHEKERLAYHEAGIVVLNWYLKETDPVIKTTILPRGEHRTGVTQQLPQNIYISTQERLLEKIVGRLGGYVAQEHFFKDVSTTAAADLQRATSAAEQMVCTYGMDPQHVGHLGFELHRDDAIQKPFGPIKEDAIDEAVERIMQHCLARARALLQEKLHQTRVVAGMLLRQETLTAQELYFVLGDRPVMSKEFCTYLES